MVQCKVLKQLDILQTRKFEDPDIVEDLEFLNETLYNSVQDLRFASVYFSLIHACTNLFCFMLYICC